MAKAIENEDFLVAKNLLGRGTAFVDTNDHIFFRLYENRKFSSLCFLFNNNLCGPLSPVQMQAVWVAACAEKTDKIALELLRNGLDPTLPSLISSAIFYGRKELIQVLDSKGVAVARFFHECITGHMAVWMIRSYGADPFTKNSNEQVLCQDKVLVKKDIVTLTEYKGRFAQFILSEADYEALKVHQERTQCNLLNLAFLLGNEPFVKELKVRYPNRFDTWLKELREQYPEKSLTALNAICAALN